jgi:hypothetical protein
MADFEEHDNPERPRRQWRDDNPSSRPLKLALLAAAIICVIAIVVYLKARHHPPALHDILQHPPASRSEPGSMRAAIYKLYPFPSA